MSLDRKILQINPTVTRITGYSADEMVLINPTDLVVEEDRYLDRNLFQELVNGQSRPILDREALHSQRWHIFWGRINFGLVRDAHQKPLYIVGIIEDITEEKRAAERIVAQEC